MFSPKGIRHTFYTIPSSTTARHLRRGTLSALAAICLASCSSTSSLDKGEQLYIGLKPIEWSSEEGNADHTTATKEEIEAALATAPNGALFGSSYYRTPFPYGLWIWNACHDSHGVIKKWLNNSFGKAPVLLENVNPTLRTLVAENVLKNNGYFHGSVDYDIIEGKPRTTRKDSTLMPRTAKIKYSVDMGHLFLLDTISYNGFPERMAQTLNENPEDALRKGDPFTVAGLDEERARIYKLFREQGFYYYQKPYLTFLADTLYHPGYVELQANLADSLPEDVTRRWVIGSTEVRIRKSMREELTDSVTRRYLTIRYSGEKPHIRPGVLLRNTKLRPGDLFSQSAYEESLNNLSSLGVFSNAEIAFTPRVDAEGNTISTPDTVSSKDGVERAGAGVLDMVIDAVLDKPYDVTLTATAMGKTNNRVGPGLTFGIARRNAFRGGELLSFDIGASYEFQTGGNSTGNSYDFTLGTSLTMPRLLIPHKWRFFNRRWYVSPQTVVNISAETIRKAGFFSRNVLSGEISYYFQPTATSKHTLTPLSIMYGHTTNTTAAYEEKLSTSVTAQVAARDELTPRMKYKYVYTSPASDLNPIYWETQLTEAGNLTNAIYTLAGKKWNEDGKRLLGTRFSQFVKIETDFKKTWGVGMKSSVVLHAYAGVIIPYGNSDEVPYSDQFFLGGANDMRGFSLHNIGPGDVNLDGKDMAYLYHNGDTKLVVNLEYRPHLFGSLYGALFIDAGNLWYLKSSREESLKEMGYSGYDTKKLDMGIDIGGGFRYDLDFFVLRLDWGLAIHSPYKTGHSGFFNIRKFADAQCLNFAIGYPF